MIEYGLIFLTGVLASLHCVGMCGAIVLAYAANSASANGAPAALLLHAAYNGGRILSYGLVGACIGYIGVTFASIQHVGDLIAIVGGGLMIIAGLAMLTIIPLPAAISLGGTSGVVRKFHVNLLRQRTVRSKLLLGFLTPVLPCGILYPMIAKAAAAETVFQGAATMVAFGLGMTPALTLLGSVSSFFSARMRRGAEILAAVTIIFMGSMLLLRGFHVPYLSWMSSGHSETKCPACGE